MSCECQIPRDTRTDFKPPVEPLSADADTLGLYHCDEGEGLKLIDTSGNENHGRIVRASWWQPGEELSFGTFRSNSTPMNRSVVNLSKQAPDGHAIEFDGKKSYRSHSNPLSR